MMRKIIYIILGLIFIPLIIAFIFIAIPLFLLFLLFLRIFSPRRRKSPASHSASQRERPVRASEDVYDVECEVVDDDTKK